MGSGAHTYAIDEGPGSSPRRLVPEYKYYYYKRRLLTSLPEQPKPHQSIPHPRQRLDAHSVYPPRKHPKLSSRQSTDNSHFLGLIRLSLSGLRIFVINQDLSTPSIAGLTSDVVSWFLAATLTTSQPNPVPTIGAPTWRFPVFCLLDAQPAPFDATKLVTRLS
ncbi:hypothetical protein LZ31DRAFT_541458 [Colletotrichum somersetense]|nr:hypothetical protein LZ31DRAFT_541458 [Colletotrichum somersetense]